MAVDKLVDSAQLNADLTSVANAIRTKGGTSSPLAFPAGFVSAVEAIPTGGGGGSISVVDNLVVNDDAISVKFDISQSWGESYNFLIIEVSVVYDVAEWLYYNYDTTSPSTYLYGSVKAHWVMLPIRYNSITGMWETIILNGQGARVVNNRVNLPSYLYLKSYKNQASFKGTKITVYGGNL